jgi:hypothetical protein
MSKYWKWGVAAALVAALGIVGPGVALAQGNTPETPPGLGPWGPGVGPGAGPLAEYRDVIHQALADALGISVDDFEAAIADGQTLVDLADEHDVDLADLRDTMEQVRADALAQAVDDGVITQEQADWMQEHGLRMAGRRLANCTGTGPMGNGGLGLRGRRGR